MRDEVKRSVLRRLSRVRGQVGGIARMVEADRHCIDIVNQVSAARAALNGIEQQVLSDHITHCVNVAINSGSRDERDQRRAELLELIRRSGR